MQYGLKTFVAGLMMACVLPAAMCFRAVEASASGGNSAEDAKVSSLSLVVMDPLAAPLACDCVQGYAQRKYEALGEYLTKKLGREVNVVWAESLKEAMEKSGGKADLIIGKHSVVRADAKEAGLKIRPVAKLTGLDDKTTQTGWIVVRKDDPAKTVADLKGYRILFGPEDCDEKYAAPIALLKENGIEVPEKPETAPSCSTAAVQLMELPATDKAAAVISSYAGPLLEGCGKIEKGDLRVIGESKPVPFITMFARREMPDAELTALKTSLEDVALEAKLLIDLESGSGFELWKRQSETLSANEPAEGSSQTAAKKKN
ncbi:MAG: PhnD/SsuA/transferrin family substrate-binding protein [Planctomyces sp.]|nr:PhnD/SsuA/transferrin family substrate-binding protein [Planctomyces sp.]